MMKFTFKNPLEVSENDMFGTAFLKEMTKGYIKGTLAGLAGLGVLAIGCKMISNKIESSKENEEELDETEELKIFKVKAKNDFGDEFEFEVVAPDRDEALERAELGLGECWKITDVGRV